MIHKLIPSNNRKIIAILAAMMIFVIIVSLTAIIVHNYTNQLRADHEYEVSLAYHNMTGELQNFTNQNVSLLKGFSAFIKLNDMISDDDVYAYLDYLLSDSLDDIRNIGILKDTTILWAYPQKGNEAAIGVDLSKIPEQAEVVNRVKKDLVTLFVGPVKLVQGGTGFIIRMPLIREDAYWGMVSIVLKADQAFKFVDEFSQRYKIDYLITFGGDVDNVIYGNPDILNRSPLKFKTKEALGGWDVYTVPRDGWNNYSLGSLMAYALSVLLGLILARYAYRSIIRYEHVLADKLELEQKYILDRFTGIYTREHFNMRVREEFTQSGRHGYSMSMIYFDLDHFKNVNDTFGHATGDKVLKSVVSVVKKIIRNEDVFARWGGDEFILLLPHVDLDGARIIAERIRFGIETMDINQVYGVTASLGCSQWKENEYMESWFARTDKALYQSKNTGKNRVTVSDHTIDEDILVMVKWNDAWNTNHPLIDKEHKKLLERCNVIIESSLDKDSFDETYRNISAYLTEVEQHFKDEILILREVGYPRVNEHEMIHENLLKSSKEVCEKTLRREVTPNELFNFLLMVVMEGHIVVEDKKYHQYLQ